MASRAHLAMLTCVFALGCGTAPPPTEGKDTGQTCATDGATLVFIVSAMDFTRATESGAVPGFDLDGVVSGDGDPAGCGHGDLMSPDGTPGVDNAFAALVPLLESIGAGAVEGLIEDAIHSGELLLLLEISGVDDLSNDTCVDLSLSRGTGVPLLATDGTLQVDQTFAVDTARPATGASGGTLTDGVIEVDGFDLMLPVQILDEFLEFEMEGGALRLSPNEDGTYAGQLAGGVVVASLAGQIAAIPDIGELRNVVPPIIEGAADLWPDESGACTHLSLGFDVVVKPAFLMDSP